MDNGEQRIQVEVAYALPRDQRLVSCRLPEGATVSDAVAASRLTEEFPDIDPGGANPVGIFGRRCGMDEKVKDGDRVEIYRPLKADPKEVRRRLAAEGKTMGRRRSKDG